MNNETQNLPSLLPSQAEFNMFQIMARNAQSSGLYGVVGGESKIFMVLLAARELGISPMIALNGGIWNIQGKIEVSARLMNAMIRRAGHSITVKVSDDKICTLVGKRKDGDVFECSFSIDDAAKAGLASRDVWKKYANDMLYNRCMSRLARRLFPDVIGTAYVEGELEEKDIQKLSVAEFQEINPVKSEPIIEIETITENELNLLSTKMGMLSDDNVKQLYNRLNLSKIYKLNDIPRDKYHSIMNWIELMLDKQSNEVSV